MLATWLTLSPAQALMAGDLLLCFLAISFTGPAHLLSLFPSLSTGLTALPRILAYLALPSRVLTVRRPDYYSLYLLLLLALRLLLKVGHLVALALQLRYGGHQLGD